jgi:hypothetical protein
MMREIRATPQLTSGRTIEAALQLTASMEVWMRSMLGSFAMLILGRRNKQLSQVAVCHDQEGVPSSIRDPTLRGPKEFRKLYTLPTTFL